MGVRLPLAPPDGRDLVDSEVVGSPKHDIAPLDFPQDLLNPHLEELAPDIPGTLHPVADIGSSTLRPKWLWKLNIIAFAKNNTWILFDLPPGKKPISYKWVYNAKYKADGALDKYKAPRAWYIKIDQYLSDQGFQRSPSDSNLYVKTTGGDILLLVIYVDDLIITSRSSLLIEHIKQSLCQSFDMTDLGLLHYCLGVEVGQTDNNIFISQSKYAKSLLDKFRMRNCKPSSTPMEKWLKLSAKSDSPVVDESLFKQLVATKRVLRYVKSTSDFGILYGRSKGPRLIGFTDQNWAGFVDERKSTSGYVFNLGTGAITWTNKKQQAVALSSTESKYQ
ncbi:uncharacterized mitochondrial protein AtMg00810-like [Cryptomeria japonica]|uniref:uncharacterized mitochondrial protein AtMg00810-like n=1 Tax=Cryptomeria japonica TaxID=3369 RepID=UPI0027DA7D1D|nr:uncharacterized mitochondrial protein AtMg00810-like [Cryptomeria japonica]